MAKLQKQQSVMDGALPFLGAALVFSVFAGTTAGVFGLAPAAGTPAGEAFLGSGTGVFMLSSGGLGFYNEMEAKADALRQSTEGANRTPTPPVIAGTVVSPIYTMPPDRYGVTRDFLVYETDAGRQAFYRSSGGNSGMAGRWLPFDELQPRPGGYWVAKRPYTQGEFRGAPSPASLWERRVRSDI